MSIEAILKEKCEIVNNELNKYVNIKENPQKVIYDSMSYSLFAGGKRLRPVIMLLVCDMLSGDVNEVLPFACAQEMIHTYSLIHDDLPCMDDDDLRRGKPTNHKVYGEAIAVLAGDSLLNKAFEVVSGNVYKNSQNALKAISELSTASGTEGMIGGQVVDIEAEGKTLTYEELIYLQTLKTGAIIRSAGKIGAIMSGANDEQIAKVDEYCKNLGIAFQIQDDILDVVGTVEELGKPIGSDDENDKNTFVSLFGIEKAKEEVKKYSDNAISALEIFGDKAQNLVKLAEYLIYRKK